MRANVGPLRAPDFGAGAETIMSDGVGAKSKSGPAIGSGPGADGSKEARTPISPTIAATANAPDTISEAGLTS